MYNYNNMMNNYGQNNNSNMYDMFDEFNVSMNGMNMNDMNISDMYNMSGMYNNMNNNPNGSLFTPKEGFNKGNLFRNLYSQYKNYKPIDLKDIVNDDESKLFLEYASTCFAMHELNLYLDLNPNDNSMLTLFNDYRKKANELKEQYEKSYGPICITSNVLDNSPFLWEEMKWPWEGGKK